MSSTTKQTEPIKPLKSQARYMIEGVCKNQTFWCVLVVFLFPDPTVFACGVIWLMLGKAQEWRLARNDTKLQLQRPMMG